MEETGSKDVFVNFVLGHIPKNERPKNRKDFFESEYADGSFYNNLETEAKKIEIKGDIKNVRFTYSNVETNREVEKKMTTWNNPPLPFPVKICKINTMGQEVFKCLTCDSNSVQHESSCTHQNNDDLEVNTDWVRENYDKIKRSIGSSVEGKKNFKVIQDKINTGKSILYKDFTKGIVSKKQISFFNRISVTKKIKDKNVIFDIYPDATIRIFRLPIEQDWEKVAEDFVKTLNDQTKYPYEFNKNKSFVYNQRVNFRVLEKDNFDFNISLDLIELKNSLDPIFQDSDSDSEPDSEFEGDLTSPGNSNRLVYTLNFPYNNEIKNYQNTLTTIDRGTNWYRLKITIFDKGGINVNMNVLKFNDEERKGAYTNLYFHDKIREEEEVEFDLPKTPDLNIKEYDKIQKIIKIMEENVSLLYIKDGQRLKNSVKHLTWDGNEPSGGKISFRPSQPFNRALEPYGFTGKPIYQSTYLDFRGIKINNRYYPTCTPKPKTLREHICAKIVGFPRNVQEARKYGFGIKNGKYVDVSSGIKKYKPGWSRVIEPNPFITEEQRKYIIKLLEKDKECSETTLKQIFNHLEIDANKFEKCLMKDIFKINTLEDKKKFQFPKEFPKPLTFTNLIKICDKEISLHIIPVDAIISCKQEGKIYYIHDGQNFEREDNSKEKCFGYIFQESFTQFVYTKTSNVLKQCKKELEKNKKQLVFITKDNECYYWSSKGYSELSYNCEVVPIEKQDKLLISIKNINNDWKKITDKNFYQFYYPKLSALRTIEGYNNKPGEIKVSGVYNRNGEIYYGKPIKKVKDQLKVEEDLTTMIEQLENKIEKSKTEQVKEIYQKKLKKALKIQQTNIKEMTFNKEKFEYIKNKTRLIGSKITVNDFKKCIEKCIINNNFHNLLHIHYPITKDFFTKKAKYAENIEFHKFIFPYSTDPNFKIWIENYIDSIIPGNDIRENIEDGFIMVFYDKDDKINYYITDIAE